MPTYTRPIRTPLCVTTILLLFCNNAGAQDLDAIHQKYKDEQAVITNAKERLIIKNEHGSLTARSDVSKEKLLIGPLSPGLYNKVYIYHSFLNKLEEHDEEALIPGKNGYKKIGSFSSKTSIAEQNNIFYDDAKETEVSFSSLTPGSVIRSEYTLSHRDINMLPAFYFAEGLAVVKSTYEVVAPAYVNMKFVIKGDEYGRIRQSRQENKNTVTYTFTVSDMPVMKTMDYVPSVSWYELHIIPFITSYEIPGATKKEMLSDPAHLYAYFYNYIRHVNSKDDEGIIKVATEVIKGANTTEEKAARIYKWVQQNMHYIAFEDSLGGFIPRDAADICKRKFGDCKDMTSILVALCRSAGIDAYFTWIGTRHKPYTYEETPLPIVANHMICSIKSGDKWIFLDGTDPVIPFGENPDGLQEKEGMIAISEKEYKIITVPEKEANENVIIDTTIMKISKRKASGKLIVAYKGYPAWDMQARLMYNTAADRKELLKFMNARGSNKYTQENSKFTITDTLDKSCQMTADYAIDEYISCVDKEYFVNMNVNRYMDETYIDTAGRSVPFYFKYKSIERECVMLDIPEGFHVSYLPPGNSETIKDGWSYNIKYRQVGRYVILTKEYNVNSMSVKPPSFLQHNKMIEDLKNQYKESVVLTSDL